MKKSGGGIYGFFDIKSVEFLSDFNILKVKEEYNNQITADDDFWNAKIDANYGTLIYVKTAHMSKSYITYKRTGMDGWIILKNIAPPYKILFSGHICAGKSTLSKELAQKIGGTYIHFGTYIRKVLEQNNILYSRTDMQEMGIELRNKLGDKGIIEQVTKEVAYTENSTLIFDGVRHIGVLEELRLKYPDIIHIHVSASQNDRYVRYITRDKKISRKEFKEIDSNEAEKEIDILASKADYVIHSNHNNDIKYESDIITNVLIYLISGRTIL
ncbi:AAA family ATPase [Candidatus Methanomassiliicoccus intestinalis]|uniref:AAA family ATPase n=1 Tax=Candidatus Methanomassiliicoccus intestinalis TaxID=1406512 RepID=UPI0037DD44DA